MVKSFLLGWCGSDLTWFAERVVPFACRSGRIELYILCSTAEA